jgi:uncharacterized protein (TIGR02145 family)
MIWDGWNCTGYATVMTWDVAVDSCPQGFRLPLIDEFLALLSECNQEALAHETYGGSCMPCGASPACDPMFTDDQLDADTLDYSYYNIVRNGEYWTSETSNNDESFFVDLGGGLDLSNMLDDDFMTLCIEI